MLNESEAIVSICDNGVLPPVKETPSTHAYNPYGAAFFTY
jgi:hypothetical protein